MAYNRYIILVIDSDSDPIYETGRELWRLNAARHGARLFFLRARPDVPDDTVYLDGDVIYSSWVEEMHPRINDKTHKAIQYCLENVADFDYILRTNLSSFYRLDLLANFLESAPKEAFYAGPLTHLAVDIEEGGKYELDYISGSGIVMSKDLIPILLGKKPEIPTYHVDDIWIGVALLFLPRHDIPRCDLTDIRDIDFGSTRQVVARLEEAAQQGIFHFRIKNAGKHPRYVIDSLVFSLVMQRFLP